MSVKIQSKYTCTFYSTGAVSKQGRVKDVAVVGPAVCEKWRDICAVSNHSIFKQSARYKCVRVY